MSYDKGKTIKEYMQGGYAQPMKYANGGYIPGVSNALYRTGLSRRVGIAQDEQREQAKALAKHGRFRNNVLGAFKKAGTMASLALAPVTGGGSFAIKGGIDALTNLAGEKTAELFGSKEYKKVGEESSTGLLDTGFKTLGDIRKEFQTGSVGRALASGFDTALKAGGGDYMKAHGLSMFGKGLSKLGIDPNKIMGGAPPVTPELLDASPYTDRLMANVPTPPPTLGTIGGAGGASSAFNLGEGISNIGRGLGLEQFSEPVYPDISSYGSYNPINPELLSSFVGPPRQMNQGGSVLPKGLTAGGNRSYRRGAGIDYLDQVMNQRSEGNALRDAFKKADENKDMILGQARQRIADEDALNMEIASSLEKLGEINRADKWAKKAQAGEGMYTTNEITDLLGTMQDGIERDLSMDIGGESARTDRFGGQTFSVPEVGMQEEGDDEALKSFDEWSLLGRTLGPNAGGITSNNMYNILKDLAIGQQAQINKKSDIFNPKSLGVDISYKRRGYAGGGLINMLPFNRRIM